MYKLKWFWNWVRYYRKGKVIYDVFDYGNTFMAMASDGTVTVVNCYGSTKDDAKKMADWRLQKAKERIRNGKRVN